MTVSRKRLYLIDGMSHIYRAYYAIRELRTTKGFPTNAIYGFTSMLRKLIQEEKPDYIGVALDVEGPSVRHEKFEAYKATRKPMPEDLVQQIPYIRRVCEAFCVPVIGFPGYEADDVIGTLSAKAAAQGLTSIVVTSDKDMMQLVNDDIVLLDPMKDNLVLDRDKVQEKLGVSPDQVPDLLGLWGDTVDNIPGAPGIGEKGARELIQTFGTVEACLQNWDKVKKKTYQESLKNNAAIITTSKELATIRKDLPILLELDSLVLCEPDRRLAFELFAELEFQNLMREFVQEEVREPLKAEWFAGEAAERHLNALHGQPRIYFTLGLQQGLLSRKTADFACVQGETGPAILIDLQEKGAAEAWARLLKNPAVVKVCWDAKLCRLSQECRAVELDSNVEDVMLFAFLVSPQVGDYSLRRWALDQLHISLSDESTGLNLLSGLERDTIALSLCRELDAVRRMHGLLVPQLSALALQRVYEEIEKPLIPVLADMERTGIKIDPRTLRDLSGRMEAQLSDLTGRIYGAAGTEFNINSPKQLGEVLFEKLNLPTLKKTRKTGGYSTDQAVLEELAQSYEIPRLILEFRQISKLKSTYVDCLPLLINPRSGRVHTSFNQTGAATGRISSSDPNLQNIPVRSDTGRLIRGAFVPEQGNLLISADYSQVELRVLAHLSHDEVLTDAFRRNEDIHERTAREVFTDEQLRNRGECRRMAKVINFGIVYGLSAFGLAQRLGIGRDAAQQFIDAYFARYHGVREWLDRTLQEVRKSGSVHTMFGRMRPVPEIFSKDYATRQFGERIAVNTPIQGSAADIMKLAMIRIFESLRQRELSAKILLQVHDELVLECPREEIEAAGDLVRHDMETAVDLLVPLRVDLNIAGNWKDMK
jgi:DNA polymerase-1